MIKDFKIDAFSRPVSDLADSPEISAGELKAHFDSNSYELLESLNGLIDYLSGDNALGELKISGKSLYELLEQKVSKEAGKGLSTNDYTTEEKNKLASLSGFDESKINERLANKVDKEAGKGLSSNDYTTNEKNKLASLSNYNDSSLKQSIANKVDKEAGKGLSSNDYTTEEKNKLASLFNYDDAELRELINNIGGAIPEIDYKDIDDINLANGVYKLVNAPSVKIDGLYSAGPDDVWTIHEGQNGADLLFVTDYLLSSDVGDENGKVQFRHCPDGTILKRYWVYDFAEYWSNWKECSTGQSEANTEVTDNLTSTSTTACLSANMGRELNEKIGSVETALDEIIAIQNLYTGGDGE